MVSSYTVTHHVPPHSSLSLPPHIHLPTPVIADVVAVGAVLLLSVKLQRAFPHSLKGLLFYIQARYMYMLVCLFVFVCLCMCPFVCLCVCVVCVCVCMFVCVVCVCLGVCMYYKVIRVYFYCLGHPQTVYYATEYFPASFWDIRQYVSVP